VSASRKSNDPQEEILRILCESGEAETAGILKEKAVNRGIARRRFYRHLRKLVADGRVQKELLRDGRVAIEAYSIREPSDRGLFEFVCDSVGEKLVDYLDNYDETRDPEAKASKIAMLLEWCRQMDETKEAEG